ncbi:hypothetical protein AN218_02020 [Streptomyces nanshensis]|uniref:PPM-type phosphatase domain-containing protein n=2 Tax=Streptomyces nanshensis TaxID=518642 RepID=A0A1E7LC61_9ACTN|nr:hypothetical protein AN218_02020 [Streptomyces nanshensis]
MEEAAARVLSELLEQSHEVAPTGIPRLVSDVCQKYGLGEVDIFVVDEGQRQLAPLTLPVDDGRRGLSMDRSVAGLCYRTTSLRIAQDAEGQLEVWLPLLNGVERIGVLQVRPDHLDGARLRFCELLASLVTLLVLTKGAHSDDYRLAQRTERFSLPSEMVWAFLPPRTLGTRQVVCTAVLEPAQELGGDAFDHSLIGNRLTTTILDSMGHDLAAGLTSSVAMAGCRNARRSGHGLGDLVAGVDSRIHEVFPDRFCTGVLGDLDLDTGAWSWINCGHPAPLLIRHERVLPGALEREGELPLGLGHLTGAPRKVHHVQLQPGDRVLSYSDGIIEALSNTGERFGLHNFLDFLIRATAAGVTTYEALRLLIQAILRYHDGHLQDDATIQLFEWRDPESPGGPDQAYTSAYATGAGVQGAM